MTDRPILFSAPMVRALLEGRKTQTRRLLKKPTWAQDFGWPERIMEEADLGGRIFWFARETGCLSLLPIPQPKDRLWVRETWRTTKNMDGAKPSEMSPHSVEYLADDERAVFQLKGRKRSSLHMPRWASRLTLTVTEVRVQRLWKINEADAKAEGVERDPSWSVPAWKCYLRDGNAWTEARDSFATLWNSLHGADAWDANPWVAAYTFTVAKGNIDA